MSIVSNCVNIPIEQKINTLVEDLNSQGFAVTLPQINFEKLMLFTKLIEKWNKAHDLVSQKTFDQIFDHHIIDSIAAFIVCGVNVESYKNYIDIGTGAGLPGIVWHICFNESLNTSLYEPRAKRVNFLKDVRKELGLKNIEIFESRFVSKLEVSGDVVATLRALKPDSEILNAFFTTKSSFSHMVWLTNEKVEDIILPEGITQLSIPYSFSLTEKYERSLRVLKVN